MDRGEACYPLPQIIGHLLIGGHLISEERVAAHRRNRYAVKCGGRWRDWHKAPVAVKNLGKDGRLFIGVALDGRHLRVLVDMTKERIVADLTELLTKPNQLRG